MFGANWEEEKELPRVISIKGGDTVNQVPGEATAVVEGVDIDIIEEFADMIAEYSGAEFKFEESDGDIIKITSIGKSAHAYEPEKGNNALTALLFLLSHLSLSKGRSFSTLCALNSLFPHGDFLGKELGIAQKDELSGELTLNLSVMEYSLTGFSARFDCRFPICGTKENVADKAAASLSEKSFTIKGFNELKMPHHTPSESPFVQKLLKAYEDHTGIKGTCLATGGGTYVHGIEGAVAFGCMMPGADNHIHGSDEFIDIDILIKSAKMFTQVILEICK
jgi:succinyl-diaminopimelate desuccinylase